MTCVSNKNDFRENNIAKEKKRSVFLFEWFQKIYKYKLCKL